MSNFAVLHKLLKKGSSLDISQTQESLKSTLIKQLSDVYKQKLLLNDNLEREFLFLCMHYGLIDPAMTLEAIGKAQPKGELTRERVRQIIDSVLHLLKGNNSPYEISRSLIAEQIQENGTIFIRIEDLLKKTYFESFKKNVKGLISFLNDCGVKQVAYRKEYYLYLDDTKRQEVIKAIQKENKDIRKNKTILNMSKKAKTVTYVPKETKDFLAAHAKSKSLGLNEAYEHIFKTFIDSNPYSVLAYTFPKTKSWKARKGTAQWEQIGIYIEKDLFEQIKAIVKKLKKDKKSVSFMSFICQSFIWYHNQAENKKA